MGKANEIKCVYGDGAALDKTVKPRFLDVVASSRGFVSSITFSLVSWKGSPAPEARRRR